LKILKETHNISLSSSFKKAAGLLVFFGLISFFCYSFYRDNIRSYPSKIHAWTQSDRYALALNFQKNGYDLFHPQTFNIKIPSENQSHLIPENRITQADCPIHEYIIALIMTITSHNTPFVFRLYNLLYGLLGFFFLFLMVRNNTGSHVKSIAVIIFAFLSPVLVYYLDGFLPSLTSMASVLIGFYFYFQYLNNKQYRNLLMAVLFTCIAAISRTPFALFIASLFIQLLWDMIRNKKIEYKILLPFLFAFIVLLTYFIYNHYLARVYGSSFLMTIMPASNIKDFHENISFIYHNWFTSYFTIYHYLVFILFGVIFLIQWIRKKSLTEFQKRTGFLFLFTFLGSVFYFILMLLQFHDHDYYFLDSFYIPGLLYIMMCIDSFQLKNITIKLLFGVVILLFGYVGFGKCKQDKTFRYNDDINDRYQTEYHNYFGSSRLLDSLNISPDSKILVMDAYTTNTPFILMNRPGYILMGTYTEHIKQSLNWDFDYIAMQNEMILSEIVNYYPPIIDELEPVGTNGRISIYKKQHRSKSLLEFLQIKDPLLFYKSSCTKASDSSNDFFIKNIYCDSIFHIGKEREFGDVIDCDLSENKNNHLSLIFCADCRLSEFNNDNSDLVAAVIRDSEQIYYKKFALNQYLENKVSDNFRKLYFTFPLFFEGNGKIILKLYVWNNGKNEVELKNIGVWIFGKVK
jgi:hypothetical protein